MKYVSLFALLVLPTYVFAAGGSLSVSQESVLNGSVPKGAQRVPFLSLTLAASCDQDVTVRALTVTHAGLGDALDMARVYAMENGKRLTRGRSIDTSDRTATLRFVPALIVEACGERTVTIVADIAPTAAAAGEHTLFVGLVSDIVTESEVTLSSLTAPSQGTVRPGETGSVAVAFLNLLKPLRYGAGQTLARFRLEADGGIDQEIHSMLFTNEGSARDNDLRNLRVVNRRGDVLTKKAASMDGDTVLLTFDPPLRLDRNDEVLLELKGDIRASRRRTVRFVLEEESDLYATRASR